MKKSKTIIAPVIRQFIAREVGTRFIAPVEPDLSRLLFPYQTSLASFVKNHHCARFSEQLLPSKRDWFGTPESIEKRITDTRNVPG